MASKTVFEGRFLRLIHDQHWEYVTRVNARGAVALLALTPENDVILVEQYRIPLGARCIELPAGIVGDELGYENEPLEHAARRELLEETGYDAAGAAVLVGGPSAPGLSSEHYHLVALWGLHRVHDGGGVADEDITVHRVPLSAVDHWLQARTAQGVLVEPRIYAGLYFLRNGTYARLAAGGH